ncbi:MAG TPA: DegT/DnrJ/EryC1/StrS aminotransferase family protein [Gemmatimonadaceae bacterium]|nr:DegT/DnrJ/EryC1/StrS aminotransferase family protein [Gemmatimonadaceae bacterium]
MIGTRQRAALEKHTALLALDGGSPIRRTPIPPWPWFDEELIGASSRVLVSGKVNYWTGEEGRKFEEEFARFVGVRHAIVLANGTVALEAALKAVGVKPGDEVVTTSRTFLASATSAISVGAIPRFADVDRDSQNVTAGTIEAALTPKTKAIVAVHLAGWPCDMDPIMELAERRGIAVIEDCAQAHGATYKGRQVGSIGHVAAWSFCQDKIMTTGGEGGAVTTNDTHAWDLMWSWKDHGKSYDTVFRKQHPPGFRWLHERFGTNWRLTEMQSAMGRVLVSRLPEWVAKRRAHAHQLDVALREQPAIRVTLPPTHSQHAYYKYYCFVRREALRDGWSRDRIMSAITAEGIPCFSGSCSEIYLEKCFVDAGLGLAKRLPVAQELGETSLMFLVHPTLERPDIEDTIQAIEKVLANATR